MNRYISAISSLALGLSIGATFQLQGIYKRLNAIEDKMSLRTEPESKEGSTGAATASPIDHAAITQP